MLVLKGILGDKMAADRSKKILTTLELRSGKTVERPRGQYNSASLSAPDISNNIYQEDAPNVLLELRQNIEAIDSLTQKLSFVMREVDGILNKKH